MKRVISILVIPTLLLAFTSCLKESADFDSYKSQSVRSNGDVKIVAIGLDVKSNKQFFTAAYVSNDEKTEFKVPIELCTSGVATEDVSVTVSVLDSVLTNLIDSNRVNKSPDTLYTITPKSMYQVLNPNGVVIIPKGSRIGYLRVQIKPSDFISIDPYVIPFTITAVNKPYLISGNLQNGFIKIVIKNSYDGDYISNGYFYHPASPRAINKRSKHVSTLDASTVEIELGDLGGSGYLAAVTVNPDNTLTIVAESGAAGAPYTMFTSGLPSSAPGYTPQWTGSSTCNNTYDPITKTFYVRYGYKGGTGWRVTEEVISKQ